MQGHLSRCDIFIACSIQVDKDETFCIRMVDLRWTVDVVVGRVECACIVTFQKYFSDCDMTGLRAAVDIICEEPDNYPARG